MTTYANIPIENNDLVAGVRSFLRRLLETGLVSEILVPLETSDGRSVHPALVADPDRLADANPFLPVLPISAARMASLLSRRGSMNGGGGSRIAAVMRPCELRAAVELAKLRQVDLSSLLTIGIDCVGTFEGVVMKAAPEPGALSRAVETAARAGDPHAPDGLAYRPACEICVNPAPWNADLSLHLIGVAADQGILLEVSDEQILAVLNLEPGGDPVRHRQAVKNLLVLKEEQRTATIDAGRDQMRGQGIAGFLSLVETCQRCFNCTVACPICYCVECLFRTDVFAHAPERYQGWAQHRGAARLPADTLTFQVTRMAHMALSCVGCGLCTSACPADLPVDLLFQAAGRDLQALFEYVPGRDPDEPLPMAVFEQDEFVTLGESLGVEMTG